MNTRCRWIMPVWLFAAIAAALPGRAAAQAILLDKPLKAGELTLFPDLNDSTQYYYISDKPRLATDATGQQQFSFLRYVENTRSGPDQPEIREGEGGGIVHALVTLAVTDERLQDARLELRRLRPGARIIGPVVYHSGKFGLVTSFKDPQGKLSTQVVGLGNAPILDGEKAAVSIQLTKLGAKLLWESFHTKAPDISFTFEMEVGGYRSPHRALLEANFDQVYEHQAFAVGVASTYLAAEIKGAFDDLRKQGAIKLTQVGADEKLDQLVSTAYGKLTEMMFQPVGGTGTGDLGAIAALGGGAAAGQQSLLDRATTMLDKNRTEARARNAEVHRENADAATRREAPDATATAATPTPTSTPAAGPGTTTAAAPGAATAAPSPTGPAGSWSATPRTTPGSHAAAARPTDAPSAGPAPRSEETVPSFAVVATFEMKRVHQQGIFRIDLNKFTTDNLTMRFDENIGDLTALTRDPRYVREINTDDPLYQQRELVVFLDGLNDADFGQYANFVNVHLRKQHAGGEISEDEVRIDRTNFNKAGNAFKLLYGWHGDNDRSHWMEYDYQLTWSFFGGRTVAGPWQHSAAGAIAVAPPYQRRIVDLQADPAAVTAAGIRSITARIYYDLGAGEQAKQVTLNATKGQLSDRVEFMLPADRYDYGYEITWRLRGGETRSSGRRVSNEAVLFVDDVPPTP